MSLSSNEQVQASKARTVVTGSVFYSARDFEAKQAPTIVSSNESADGGRNINNPCPCVDEAAEDLEDAGDDAEEHSPAYAPDVEEGRGVVSDAQPEPEKEAVSKSAPNRYVGMSDPQGVDSNSAGTHLKRGGSFIRSILPLQDEIDVADKTPFVHPDLFREAHAMVESSFLVYCFAHLRKLARAGEIDNPAAVMDLPMSYRGVMDLLYTHRQILCRHLGESDMMLFEDMMDSFEKRLEECAAKDGIRSYDNLDPNKLGVVAFGDADKEHGLVYGIYINCVERKVHVVFRGTATYRDMKTDLKVRMSKVPNPLANSRDDQPKYIKIHSGFYKYMYNKSKKGKDSSAPETHEFRLGTRCHEILVKTTNLLNENPGFVLYVSGHSLGGALACLFAFEVAASENPNIPFPVNCVSIASPLVGNMTYRTAFSQLEQESKIRYLRVENRYDLIPLMPSYVLLRPVLAIFDPHSIYQHVGVQLRLQRGKRGFDLIYDKVRKWPSISLFELVASLRLIMFFLFFSGVIFRHALEYHNNREYSSRLKANRRDLLDLELNIFYDYVKNGEHGVLHRSRLTPLGNKQ